jgi:flagellin
MRINNNVMAANAYRNVSNTNNTLGKSLEKLSSGFRINRAADDAAGLTRSEGLRSEINGAKQAIRNAQDGVSFVQTAEGAMNEVHAILQRMRTLAVSAANSTSDGAAEQAEVGELLAELDAIGTRTTFNRDAVFADYSGTGNALTFHIGAGSSDTLSVTADLELASNSVFGATGLSSISLTSGAATAIDTIDDAIASVSTARSTLGATQNRLEHTIANVSVSVENLSAAESRIRDADVAEEMVTFTRNQILQQAGTAMLAQANSVPQSVLSLLR